MTPDYIQRWRPGPYGTNVGDIWSAEESDIGRRLKRENGLVLIHEVFEKDDGTPEERIYNVEESNPDMQMQDLIRRAREGAKRWIEEQARRN
jgi:hypothetical protein